jgi:D-alanyl-lipoteichoic acid acyltransferase DltB (MBOAT superfamily)
VYRREIEPTDSLVDYAFFLSFFPQIVAGPIVRAGEFFPQIKRTPELTRETMAFGLFRIVRGLVKKAVLADFIGVYCDLVFGQPASYGGPETLLAIYGYTLQIYFDFSGYSDMAVGMAAITGFHMPENFDAPYRATNITAFWQRWHMSLSKWLRDYLYIPLGGNRGNEIMRYRNLMLTMLLGGLWHGASWTFVLWGALHGAALSIHKAWGSTKMPAFIGWLLTIHFVAFTWVFFRATDFAGALSVLAQLGEGWQHAAAVLAARSDIVIAVAIGAALCVAAPRWSATLEQLFVRTPIYARAGALLVVIQIIVQLQLRDVQPFIYFQF